VVIERPTEWQSQVLDYDEDWNLAVFGGRGAGRTTGALFVAMHHAEAHEGAHVLFIRQMLRSLREVEDTLHLALAAQYGDKLRVNRQDHIFVLPNGSTIEFSPLNDTDDMAKLQGRSFTLVIADEYGNFSPQQMRFVDQLRANLRGKGIPCRFMLLANPGGRGHQTIKERFIDRMIPGYPGKLEDGLIWVWVPANFTVNPHNPTDYEQSLRASSLGDAELLRAWLDGAWNIARGAMFADVLDEEVQKIRRDELLDLLKRDGRDGVFGFVSGDWGQSAPAVAFACLKFLKPRYIFPRNSVVLLDEVSSSDPDNRSRGMNWPVGRFAEEMQEMCVRTGVQQVGCMDDQKSGLNPDDSLLKTLATYGFSFTKPQKSRTSGWAACRELMFNSKNRNGKPGLWVSDHCPGWWETVPLLPRDPNKPEDVDTRAVDHWADGTRYGCVYEVGVMRVNSTAETARKYGVGGPGAPRA